MQFARKRESGAAILIGIAFRNRHCVVKALKRLECKNCRNLDLLHRRRFAITADRGGVAELKIMPTAWLINASRGPIVEEQALISALTSTQVAGAAIDVFDTEPLPSSRPFRSLNNVRATPRIGYVSQGLYKTFYEDIVSNIRKWLDTPAPVNTS